MRQHSLFYYIFIRAAGILIVVNAFYLSALIPYFSGKLETTIASQGKIFANTTVAACTDALYEQDYAFIIEYNMKVIAKSPDIHFVEFAPKTGAHIFITADSWKLIDDHSNHTENFQDRKKNYHLAQQDNELIQEQVLNYSSRFDLKGLDWGVIIIGLDDNDYHELMRSLFNNALSMNMILIIVSVLILFFTSRYIRQQVGILQHAAMKLADGDFASQAPASPIQEINALTHSFNDMAHSITTQTNEITILARVVEENRDAVAVLDEKLHVTFINSALKKIARHEVDDEALNRIHFSDFLKDIGLKDADINNIIANISRRDSSWNIEQEFEQGDDETQYFNIRSGHFQTQYNQAAYHFVVLTNITERKMFIEKLNQLAFYDKLTGLPNRRLFLDRLEHTINVARRQGNQFFLMFMDLDNFKEINDSLGHDYGDELLLELAQRLKNLLREEDTICRLGGDEFTIIVNNLSDRKKVGQIANKIIANIKEPFHIFNETLTIGISIGIVNYPDDADDSNELMKKADLSMYQVKRSGKNSFHFYSGETNIS